MAVTNLDTLQLGVQLNANDGTLMADTVNKKYVGYYNTVVQVISGDGAISIANGDQFVFLTKGSAAAITIVAPTAGSPLAGGQDGTIIQVVNTTAFAHVVTCATDGFNAKGSSGTMTSSAAAYNYFSIIAYNGHWAVISNLNYTKA